MTFTADHVRIAEALYRSEAHCIVACELYGAGRPADAVMHSVRPIADTFPWIETELRSRPEQLRNLMVATSNLSGALRHAAKPRVARKHLKTVGAARRAALDVVVGPSADTDAFRASVGVALLDGVREIYGAGVPQGDLNAYQSAYALVRIAVDLLSSTGAGDAGGVREALDALSSALPTLDPPPHLLRPDDLGGLIDRVAAAVSERYHAIRPQRFVTDDLARVERLLDDVVRSYGDGVAALAARVAASLYVRTYDPIRDDLRAHDPGTEERLAETLGVDLRRAINAGAPVADVAGLADRARDLIAALSKSVSSSLDDAACGTRH